MTKFQAGATYQTPSICDHNCIFSYTVISRTEKTVTIKSRIRGQRRCKISVFGGVETIFPEGRYSMCPVIDASKIAA